MTNHVSISGQVRYRFWRTTPPWAVKPVTVSDEPCLHSQVRYRFWRTTSPFAVKSVLLKLKQVVLIKVLQTCQKHWPLLSFQLYCCFHFCFHNGYTCQRICSDVLVTLIYRILYFGRKKKTSLFVFICNTVIIIKRVLNKCTFLVKVRRKHFEEKSISNISTAQLRYFT